MAVINQEGGYKSRKNVSKNCKNKMVKARLVDTILS